MTITLYDISVATYAQALSGLAGVLQRGRDHCEAQGIDPAEILQTRLFADMLPLSYQVTAALHHSLGTMRALQSGQFSPPTQSGDDYAGLQARLNEAQETLRGYTPEQVNDWADDDVTFVARDRHLPFRAADFVLSFSLPNLFFHTTTAYDILRMRGVPIGKRDFSGPMRIRRRAETSR